MSKLEFNEVETHGIVTYYFQHDNVTDSGGTIKNAWMMDGKKRIRWCMGDDGDYGAWYNTMVLTLLMGRRDVGDSVGFAGAGASKDITGGTPVLCITNYNVGPDTFNALLLMGVQPTAPGTGTVPCSSVSLTATPITVPTGWTLMVDWRTTIGGTFYNTIWTNNMVNHLLNSGTWAYKAESLQLYYGAGAPVCVTVPIMETIAENSTSTTIYISAFKGSFVSASQYLSCGTVALYGGGMTICGTTFALFDKPANVELHVEHRNTIN